MNYNDYEHLLLLVMRDENTELIDKLRVAINNSRCPKCVHQGECTYFDDGNCKNYKRDPPDCGYYG